MQPTTECPNNCTRFGGKVPGHSVGSNWPWVPCPLHPTVPPTPDELLVAELRAECVEFHAADGVTDDCAYVRAADRIVELVGALRDKALP